MIDVYDSLQSSLDNIQIEGTTRQIAWASAIRYKATLWLKYGHDESYMKMYARFLKEHTYAEYWIEHKDDFYFLRHEYEAFCNREQARE